MSAFWAVVGIALNTMTLQSGRVLGLPSSWNFAVRSSPIICAFAALDSVARLAVYSYQENSLRGGRAKWIAYRFEDHERSSDGFTGFRANKCTIVLFGFGTLMQAVKIFSTNNAPLTQAICAAYLASFAVDGLIFFCRPQTQHLGSDNTTLPAHNHSARPNLSLYSSLALAASLLSLPARFLYLCFRMRAGDIQPNFPMEFGFCVFPWNFAAVPLMSDLAFPSSVERTNTTAMLIKRLSAAIIAGSTLITFLWMNLDSDAGQLSPAVPLVFFLAAANVTCLLTLHSIPDRKGQDRFRRRLLLLPYTLYSLGGTYAWYTLYYDATSTSRPLWTNNLR